MEDNYAHSSVLIESIKGPYLLVVGGLDAYDCWLFGINNKLWQEVSSIVMYVVMVEEAISLLNKVSHY